MQTRPEPQRHGAVLATADPAKDVPLPCVCYFFIWTTHGHAHCFSPDCCIGVRVHVCMRALSCFLPLHAITNSSLWALLTLLQWQPRPQPHGLQAERQPAVLQASASRHHTHTPLGVPRCRAAVQGNARIVLTVRTHVSPLACQILVPRSAVDPSFFSAVRDLVAAQHLRTVLCCAITAPPSHM